MPKIKTHRGAAKRFKITASGKVKRSKCFTSHLLTCKNKKKKRNLRTAVILSPADSANIKRLLPYM
ncbi:MAG: 50S ribosomal protein L35 [Nitrospirae bacterium GWC2_42_7]|nr:MAG: 50S ribosomal protein L35 [Nitrospirae bacterium GWC2_42_7]